MHLAFDRTIAPGHFQSCEDSVVISHEVYRSEEHTSELQSLRHLVCRLVFLLSGDHRDLPSFPTRRSSDLMHLAFDRTIAPGHFQSCEDSVVISHEVYRSEEHTSELQSLRHLVCRLLL